MHAPTSTTAQVGPLWCTLTLIHTSHSWPHRLNPSEVPSSEAILQERCGATNPIRGIVGKAGPVRFQGALHTHLAASCREGNDPWRACAVRLQVYQGQTSRLRKLQPCGNCALYSEPFMHEHQPITPSVRLSLVSFTRSKVEHDLS